MFAVGYVAMAKRITAAGAFYGYISHGLGRIAGMASGMLAVLAYIVFEASIVGVFSYFAKTTVHDQLGIDLPWILYAAAMLAVTSVLAHFDINLTAKALGVMLVGEIAVLFAVATAVLLAGGGPDGIPLEPVNPKNAFTGTSAASASSSPSGPGSASSPPPCTAKNPATPSASSPRPPSSPSSA